MVCSWQILLQITWGIDNIKHVTKLKCLFGSFYPRARWFLFWEWYPFQQILRATTLTGFPSKHWHDGGNEHLFASSPFIFIILPRNKRKPVNWTSAVQKRCACRSVSINFRCGSSVWSLDIDTVSDVNPRPTVIISTVPLCQVSSARWWFSVNYLADAHPLFFVGNRLQGCRRHCSTMLVVLMMAKEDRMFWVLLF